MLHSRSSHAVVATADAIYVIGGTGDGGKAVLAVERFDGKSWREVTRLPGDGLNAPVAAVLHDRIYVIGGFRTTTNVPTSEVLVYNIVNHSWSSAAPLAEPRGGDGAAVLDGRIHVVGGGNSQRTLANHSEYDPATNKWTERAPLSRSKGSPAVVALDGKLYSIGGRSGRADYGDVEIYDPAADKWDGGPPISPRGTAGAALYCGTIFVFGGESQATNSTLSEVLRLNATRTAWEQARPMAEPRNYARAVKLQGSVYLIGGNSTVDNAHAARGSTLVERFTAQCDNQ
jgi:N-acetylneuraminic acid mutarotase